MENFKFFSKTNDVNISSIENGLIFQYQINDTYKQFEISTFTIRTDRTRSPRIFYKLYLDSNWDRETLIRITDDIKAIKFDGCIIRITDGIITNKTKFEGVLSSSEWSLNSDECKLEFYLDYYRFD
jgi:hypothetical protein